MPARAKKNLIPDPNNSASDGAPLATPKKPRRKKVHRASPPMVTLMSPEQTVKSLPSKAPPTSSQRSSTPSEVVTPPPPPILKTKYNLLLVRRLSLVLGVVVLAALALFGWSFRQQLLSVPLPLVTKPYHLTVSSPLLQATKAAQLSQGLQATASANATASPNLTPQYQAALSGYTTPQLYDLLDQEIAELKSENQRTDTLATYPVKARAVENSNPTKARDLLMEGVQLGKELQALYLYYKK
jgi:hypothetical protein